MTIGKEQLRDIRQRKYLAKDFDGFRAQLLEYARTYHSDKIKDFSDGGLGGVFLDFAAYVGDSMSFYLDHQYTELDPSDAVESKNIERHLRNSNVPITGNSPAVVELTFYIEVPAETTNNVTMPQVTSLPIIMQGTIVSDTSGIEFTLLEDLDFSEKNEDDDTYIAEYKVGVVDQVGKPTSFVMALSGRAVSGTEESEIFSIGSTFVPFKRIELSYPDVSDIISVTDDFGNVYYRVNALSDDVVYRNNLNSNRADKDLVESSLKILPAPYRFTTQTSLSTRKTTLIFGGGSSSTLEDDVIPDPSEFAISFPYQKTFSRLAINPEKLLTTKTLGIAAVNTNYTIVYRHGGGLNHNAEPNSINSIKVLNMRFPGNPTPGLAAVIRGSAEVTNLTQASGGEDAPTVDELRQLIPASKNAQERIVTREDLLSRVYSIPSNFGRVFRASIKSNPNNPLASQLFIISRDKENNLIISPDTLKRNIQKYLNPYRMISDAIDILDAKVINMQLYFSVLIDHNFTQAIVLQQILSKLVNYFDIKNFHIDQPINITDVENVIYRTIGVTTLNEVKFVNVSGTVNNRLYSTVTFNSNSYTTASKLIIPPPGGIFEIKYKDIDIIGRASQ